MKYLVAIICVLLCLQFGVLTAMFAWEALSLIGKGELWASFYAVATATWAAGMALVFGLAAWVISD